MPKRKSGKPVTVRIVLLLAALAALAFLAGEALVAARSDRVRLAAARYLPGGDRARAVQIVGKHIHRGLERAGVPQDSVRVLAGPATPAARTAELVRWRVGLKPDASFLQVNSAVTEALAEQGIAVLSGRERAARDGSPEVVLLVGVGDAATHQVTMVRSARPASAPPQSDARLALLLFGFGEDLEMVRAALATPAPFAVAIAPGAKQSPALFEAARAAQREVVLHLPLEPINYPQVNPGPGTILVTMRPAQISSMLRRYLGQAGTVAAVANQMGSLATQDMTVMAAVYRELRRERLPFLHVDPAAGAVCKQLASELGVAYDEPDALIDFEARRDRPDVLEKRWRAALDLAKARGRIVVMLRVTPMSLRWMAGALELKRLRGVNLVPLSAVLHRPPA